MHRYIKFEAVSLAKYAFKTCNTNLLNSEFLIVSRNIRMTTCSFTQISTSYPSSAKTITRYKENTILKYIDLQQRLLFNNFSF